MLTILAKCSHSCLLFLCENWGYLASFQKKLVSSLFKLVPKYILFMAKLKGEGRPFWNGEKHSLILYTISYMVGGSNVSYYKSPHHPIPTRANKERPGSFQNK